MAREVAFLVLGGMTARMSYPVWKGPETVQPRGQESSTEETGGQELWEDESS